MGRKLETGLARWSDRQTDGRTERVVVVVVAAFRKRQMRKECVLRRECRSINAWQDLSAECKGYFDLIIALLV